MFVKDRRIRQAPVVFVKNNPVEPKVDLKQRMSLSEYQAAIERKAELDREIERLEAGLS